MAITKELNQILNATYGSEVRQSIHDAIKQTYDDAALSGNANMEVSLARGNFPVLNARLNKSDEEINEINSQLAQKAQQSDLEIERSRIDSFTTLSEGSTTGDAELIDARIGADGFSYTNAGDSIRKQISKVNKLLDLEEITFTDGYNINLGGDVGTVVNLTPEPVSPYSYAVVNCNEYDTFLIYATGGSAPRTYGFIDENNILISKASPGYAMIDEHLNVPSGATKIIINSQTSSLRKCYKGAVGVEFKNFTSRFGNYFKKQIILKPGYNVNLSVGIGNVVDLTPEVVASYYYNIINCEEFDMFIINGIGGSNPRLWGFVDANNTLLSVAEPYTDTNEDMLLIAPPGAKKLIINDVSSSRKSYKGADIPSVIGELLWKESRLNDEIYNDISDNAENVDRTNSELAYITGELNQFLIDANKPIIIQAPYKYSAWPFVSSVGDKLICVYGRGTSHEGSTTPDMYSRISSNGGTKWSKERLIISTPETRDTVTGKGKDSNGNMLIWNRVGEPWGSDTVHTVYRTSDGETFTKISEPLFDFNAAHIGDMFNVPTVGLVSFYNTFGSTRSWGVVISTDNGINWTQTEIETGLEISECPTEISGVYLQDGKILAIGRKDNSETTKASFQIESSDYGDTWTKSYTNITDIHISTSSLIYDETTDLLSLYYFDRSSGVLRLRKNNPLDIWNNPLNWSESEALVNDSNRGQDTGNVNVTPFKGKHIAAYYSGDSVNTGIYAKIVTP